VSKLVENFAAQYRRPFNVEICGNLTGESDDAVTQTMARLVRAGRAREIEPGVWQATQTHRIVNTNSVNGIRWTYRVSVGAKVIEVLSQKRVESVRDLGQHLSVSRQYAYMYLEALASLGAVTWTGSRYIGTGQDDLTLLGCVIEKGILARLKREAT